MPRSQFLTFRLKPAIVALLHVAVGRTRCQAGANYLGVMLAQKLCGPETQPESERQREKCRAIARETKIPV